MNKTSLNDCAVCLESIFPVQSISTLNCGHTYHQSCLEPWLKANNTTCPLDRTKITSINGQQLQEPPSPNHIFYREPIREARRLYQVSVIHPSSTSSDPLERQAAKIQSFALNALFGRNS